MTDLDPVDLKLLIFQRNSYRIKDMLNGNQPFFFGFLLGRIAPKFDGNFKKSPENGKKTFMTSADRYDLCIDLSKNGRVFLNLRNECNRTVFPYVFLFLLIFSRTWGHSPPPLPHEAWPLRAKLAWRNTQVKHDILVCMTPER